MLIALLLEFFIQGYLKLKSEKIKEENRRNGNNVFSPFALADICIVFVLLQHFPHSNNTVTQHWK